MKKFIFTIILISILNSCSVLFLWNPVFQGSEMKEKIEFNKDGIAISIPEFGFMNSWGGPFFKIKIGNYTDSTIYLTRENFKVVIKSDTLNIDHGNSGSLLPQTIKPMDEVELNYGYNYDREYTIVNLKDGTEISLQEPRSVKLILDSFSVGKSQIEMPTIQYLDPDKVIKKGNYYEFRKTRFL